MPYLFKVKAKRKYGDMPEGYEFQVSSSSSDPSAAIKEEIKKLGFNNQAQGYYSSGNWIIEKDD
jgi:hypothetical protein